MGKGAFIFDLMAERYARTPIANPAAYEKKLEITRKYLTPHDSVFEFGCGTGSTALLHAPYVRDIYAVDYSTKMIEIADRKRVEGAVENAKFEVADINEMQIQQETYDIVLGLNILQLMEDIDSAITKASAMLKPGGYFISSSVCMTRPPGIWGLVVPLMATLQLIPRLQGFTEQQLLESMKAAGLEIVEQYNPEDKVVSVFLVARKPVD